MQITVMTFNIQHGLNYLRSKKRPAGTSVEDPSLIDLSLVAEAIRSCGADIVALNEVRDVKPGISDPCFMPQVKLVAQKLGYPYFYFGQAIEIPGKGVYGNGLISRYPICGAETVAVPDPPYRDEPVYYESRCVIRAVIDVGGGSDAVGESGAAEKFAAAGEPDIAGKSAAVCEPAVAGEPDIAGKSAAVCEPAAAGKTGITGKRLTVLVTHMGLASSEAVNAVETVLSLVHPDEATVLMGDFNQTPGSPILKPLREIFTDAGELLAPGSDLTFPSDRPECKIDYIMAAGPVRFQQASIPELVVSDHRAHTAVVELL